MKAIRVQLAETALEKYAGMLSGKHGIRVIFKSNHAYTIGENIVLPAVPTDAPDAYVETLTGYLNREVAGIIYKEITAEMMVRFNEDSLLHTCFSAVEQMRCDHRFLEVFPGANNTMDSFMVFQADLLKENWFQRGKIQQVLAAATYTIKYGKGELYGKYLDGETRRLVDQAVAIIGDIGNISDTEASLVIGEQLRDLLIEHVPPPAQTQSGGGESGGGEDDSEESLSEQLQRKFNVEIPEEEEEEDSGGGSEEDKEEIQELDSYRIYTTEHDSVTPIEDVALEEGGMDLVAFRADANRYVGVIKHKLTNSLRTMTLARHSYGHEEGDLDTDSLYSLATRSNNRVFMRKEPGIAMDTAVAIAIDHSGSMNTRGKIKLAAECAITIGDVLNVLQVPIMVYGYSTMNTEFQSTPSDLGDYARWGALWLRTYAEFDRPWRDGALKLCKAPQNTKSNSFDGESVLFGIRRLLARKEKRKLLFVFSDGAPDPGMGHKERCKSYLQCVVKEGMKAGVEIVGFGITTDKVKDYYPHHVVLHKLEDIVKEPLNIIDQALRKGRKL